MKSREPASVHSCLVSHQHGSRERLDFSPDATDLVLVILMQIHAGLLRLAPDFGDALVDVRLMYDLGDQLRPCLDEGRIRGGDFGMLDDVLGAIFDQKGQEGEAGVDEESDDEDVDQQENDQSTPHDGCLLGQSCNSRPVRRETPDGSRRTSKDR